MLLKRNRYDVAAGLEIVCGILSELVVSVTFIPSVVCKEKLAVYVEPRRIVKESVQHECPSVVVGHILYREFLDRPQISVYIAAVIGSPYVIGASSSVSERSVGNLPIC